MSGHDNDTIGWQRTVNRAAGGMSDEETAWTQTLSGGMTAGGDGGMPVLAGRYRVVKRLGEGGMGSVWLAEDLKLDGKRFAIKMLPSVLAGKKGAYRQVKAEALMAMKLAHPNIATVRAFEEDEGGNPFLVMDFIEGEGLDDILAEKGPLEEAEMLQILGPVAAALDYAHSKGVVHRDVKPGNVMVDRNGTPFVLDFGIAREIQETMTRVTGKFSSGTLLYMSPEQLNGDAPNASQDVYSFAAMAYECLTGAPPFARGQIEWQIMNKAPADLPESVGEAVRKGIMAGLAKEAGGRPGACAEVFGKGSNVDGYDGRAGFGSEPLVQPWIRQGKAVRPEKSPGQKEMDGEIFLRKVRLGKELAAVGQEDATEEEKEGLAQVLEMYAAGEEALRIGDKGAAGTLFVRVEGALTAWRNGLEERRQREWEEAGRRRTEEDERRRKLQEKAEGQQKEMEARERKLREQTERQWREVDERNRKLLKEVEQRRKEMAELREKARRAWEERESKSREEKAAGVGEETEAAEARARNGQAEKAGEVQTIALPGGAKMDMVWCPAGEFTMGSPEGDGFWRAGKESGRLEDETQHRVALSQGFWMARTEVTQAQWRSVMGNNPSEHQGDDLPVENVSWDDCQEFCKMANLRLPTEAEWEYACRAGSSGAYAGTGALEEMGWYAKNSGNQTHPVGAQQPNAWGLYDMHGNVWEWCADWYGVYPRWAVKNPTGAAFGTARVLRGGGCWDVSQDCRSANRGRLSPDYRDGNCGFRPVASRN